ncbi:MAG: ABC transporter permease, partial [Kiritimatiellia bacterium]
MKFSPVKPSLSGLDVWSVPALLAALLILSPLLLLLSGLWNAGPAWEHLTRTVLSDYVLNTLWLTLAVGLLSVLMAVPAAWFLSNFDFPGRRFLEWGMILPLAVPGYVAAFVYRQIPEAAIPPLIQIRSRFGVDAFLFAEGLIRKGTLAVFLAAVLYPYLYLSLRSAFLVQRRGLIEAAQLLGRGPAAVFFSVALPLARPALFAGVSLVLMEVINDYGAVTFMGVPTLTVGIFRTWTGLGDLNSAVRLAGLMMLAVFVLLGLEYSQRGRARYHDAAHSPPPVLHRPLTGLRALGVSLLCWIPFSLGFLIPLLQLLIWAFLSFRQQSTPLPFTRVGHSLLLSMGTAVILTAVALFLGYAQRLHPRRWLKIPLRLACLGYAVPGAVVAVGVMLFLGPLQLIGSIYAIGFGYLVRFLAVGVHPVQAGMERICGSLDDASRLLGHGPCRTLFQVNIPLIRG